jgi:chromosome segregation ATPase
MGLGGTAKKIQTLADKAEQTYKRLNDLRDEVEETQRTVTDTAERVGHLETEMAEQRAVLDAVAEEVGVDLEAVSTDAHIHEAEEEPTNEAENGADTPKSTGTAGDTTADGTTATDTPADDTGDDA